MRRARQSQRLHDFLSECELPFLGLGVSNEVELYSGVRFEMLFWQCECTDNVHQTGVAVWDTSAGVSPGGHPPDLEMGFRLPPDGLHGKTLPKWAKELHDYLEEYMQGESYLGECADKHRKRDEITAQMMYEVETGFRMPIAKYSQDEFDAFKRVFTDRQPDPQGE